MPLLHYLEMPLLHYYYRPQRSCAKIMFPQASVILFTGGWGVGGHVWVGRGVHDKSWACVCGGGGVRGRRDGLCSGRYASYWNAFLLQNICWTNCNSAFIGSSSESSSLEKYVAIPSVSIITMLSEAGINSGSCFGFRGTLEVTGTNFFSYVPFFS